MEIISVFAALVVLAVSLLSTKLIENKLVAPSFHGRFLTIDGLRGYLAVFVFLHHSCIWYYYLQSGIWALPPSKLFVHFGQIGVALFFMITGFLFFNQILDGRVRKIDWARLYLSRLLRLAPLYFLSTAILFVIVWVLTKDLPPQPLSQIAISALKWLGFTMLGAADLNGLPSTWIINAGVTWTLPYEWFFYLFLPIVAALMGCKPPVKYFLLTAFAVYVLSSYGYDKSFGWLFFGGMLASLLVRHSFFIRFANSKAVSLSMVLMLVFVVSNYSTIYSDVIPRFLLVIVFCFVGGGNSLFGILSLKVSRALGEMAYGIYLLHGILLFSVFTFLLGFERARQLSPLQFWGVISLLTPILIVVCGFTFRFIEKPFMNKVNVFTGWFRAKKRFFSGAEKAA
ncbi:Peptidoglycan/LPS O-acetylase OafA/YrhL, contains acyltransferase and SGNH-hydrolase domains [Pseudomonas sp. NFR02]|uniref:acyltransferase family protein n=1 Tax=Pseudomonas sp. NFR02 TaxID=1566229 RepID=UPI00091B9DEC|nr:acyltransferase [Pseudomonas sp. NFR02]SFX26895.1 Peptidoglycan/LPS O-acetylase OafA/YrhL, contains acyltransferase and SGNH-hydrolase domains [Pseudomonas sp. NFR02]